MRRSTELTERQARSQLRGLLCGDCGGDVTHHLLLGATHHRGDKCPWTWIGVVRRACYVSGVMDGVKYTLKQIKQIKSGKAQVTIKEAKK